MKGIVFNLLEEIVVAQYGEDTWDDLLDDAGLDGAYTSLGNYVDEDLMRLVAAASARLELPADEVVRWFGRNATPIFKRQYPDLFAPHDSTWPFVLTLNEIIHPPPPAKSPRRSEALCLARENLREILEPRPR